MRIRLANEGDLEQGLALAKTLIESTRPDMVWSESQCRATFWDYMDSASPTIWVAEEDDKLVGFLMADMYAYRAAEGIFVTQEVLYVDPAHRGGRVASRLLTELLAWANTLGAKEIVGGSDNGFKPERMAKWLKRHDFKPAGVILRRDLTNGSW